MDKKRTWKLYSSLILGNQALALPTTQRISNSASPRQDECIYTIFHDAQQCDVPCGYIISKWTLTVAIFLLRGSNLRDLATGR
ncbi:MAG: hypothetical protein E7080_04220 [Bacteroidales bacterium]|nr:hypothetical protein [Bacteroidales bacterium]